MKWFRPGENGTRVEGLGFYYRDGAFRRLMLESPEPLPGDVDMLAWNTAGVQVRFRGTFSEIQLRARLRGATSFRHMTPIGEGGFDLYVKRDGDRDPVFCAPAHLNGNKAATSADGTLFRGERTDAEVILNFPPYSGVDSVEIGVDDDAVILPPREHKGGRILVYGGSIDQGCSASRPGMVYTNILSRWMDSEFINLGFSGSGRAEHSVAVQIREIPDISMFVINTAGNIDTRTILRERFPVFISVIRERYPETPILVYSLPRWVSDRFGGRDPEISNEGKAEELERLYRETAENDSHIYFLRSEGGGETFDGHPMQYEHTVDWAHPNDFGIALMARELYFKLGEIKKKEGIV